VHLFPHAARPRLPRQAALPPYQPIGFVVGTGKPNWWITCSSFHGRAWATVPTRPASSSRPSPG